MPLPLTRLLIALAMALVATMNAASALQLTPEQLKLAESLSPAEKQRLAQQLGGASKPASELKVESTQPIQPRSVGSSRVEQEVKAAAPDERQLQAEVKPATAVQVPVAKTGGQAAAERLEMRRAFADFVAESKPLKVDASSLKLFGYEIFAGQPSTFAPATDVPVPPEYVLGPGDEIKVQLFGRMSDLLSLVVDRDGAIAFPEIGPIQVAGMSFGEVKKEIERLVKDKLVGVSANVTMGKLRSIRVFALGEVARPGSYIVSGLATLSHALLVSGGVRKTGSLRRVQLKRGGRVVATLDLYDFLLRGDTSKDVRLLPGDVVFVPRIGKTAGVAGEVLRPAIYELKTEKTVGDLLQLAGGLLPKAYRDKALIERLTPKGEREVISVRLKGRGLRTRLRDGDVLKVFSAIDFEENPVLLIGNVKRPGKYAWHKGMKLSELLPSMDALLPETFMDYGVIEREAEGTREPEILRFRLADLFRKGKARKDVPLKPRDKVYVFHRAHFRVVPTATVAGSVKSPGDYEIKKDMRLFDLIMAAGGFTRDSLMTEAELYRTDPVTKEVRVVRFSPQAVVEGDPKQNVLLQDLDRVVIHSIWEKVRHYPVYIAGEVKKPGEYKLAEGMRVADLVFAAGNVTDRAYLKKAELTRYEVVDGEKRETHHLDVDLEAALAGDEKANLPLQPYDRLTVRPLSNWRAAEYVTISGEVKFPGTYPIEEGETLASVIERAGGYTEDAYLPAAVFRRVSIQKQQEAQLARVRMELERAIAQEQASLDTVSDPKVLAQKQAALASAKKMLEQYSRVQATGRMVVQLSSLARMKRHPEEDVRLQDGDSLFIPKRPDHVLVMGEVYAPNAQRYQKGKSYSYYIGKAGGPTRFADEDHIYILRANGEVEPAWGWFTSSIQPGDAIIVPEDVEHFSVLGMALDWSKVLYQIGVALASMKTIGIL